MTMPAAGGRHAMCRPPGSSGLVGRTGFDRRGSAACPRRSLPRLTARLAAALRTRGIRVLVTEVDATLGEVIDRQFQRHTVTRENADVVLAYASTTTPFSSVTRYLLSGSTSSTIPSSSSSSSFAKPIPPDKVIDRGRGDLPGAVPHNGTAAGRLPGIGSFRQAQGLSCDRSPARYGVQAVGGGGAWSAAQSRDRACYGMAAVCSG